MVIRDCMKLNVISIKSTGTIGEAAQLLAENKVGMLPVVDEENVLVGHLQLNDVLSLVMPIFVRLIEDFDFVHDFGAVEDRLPSLEAMSRPVSEVMQEPVFLEDTCGLMRAFATLREHTWNDLPIVDADGRLVGIASRVDIGAALLRGWQEVPGPEGAE